MKITTIGIDLAKNVLQAHGVDEDQGWWRTFVGAARETRRAEPGERPARAGAIRRGRAGHDLYASSSPNRRSTRSLERSDSRRPFSLKHRYA